MKKENMLERFYELVEKQNLDYLEMMELQDMPFVQQVSIPDGYVLKDNEKFKINLV